MSFTLICFSNVKEQKIIMKIYICVTFVQWIMLIGTLVPAMNHLKVLINEQWLILNFCSVLFRIIRRSYSFRRDFVIANCAGTWYKVPSLMPSNQTITETFRLEIEEPVLCVLTVLCCVRSGSIQWNACNIWRGDDLPRLLNPWCPVCNLTHYCTDWV